MTEEERIKGAMDVVHTGESRSPRFNPKSHRATISPLPDGDQIINIMPLEEPIPPGSRLIDPVE